MQRKPNNLGGRAGIALALACSLALAACGQASGSQSTQGTTQDVTAASTSASGSASQQEETPVSPTTSEENMSTCTIRIANKTFEAQLETNPTAQSFAKLLPLDLTMEELNGNEKYHFFDQEFPSNPSPVGHVEAGDLMLYGNDCVVLFYKSFDTPYSYTRIGRIADVEGLEQAVGSGNVTVSFAGV